MTETPAWSCLPSVLIRAGRESNRCRCGNACRRRDGTVFPADPRDVWGENLLKNVFYFVKEEYKEPGYEARALKRRSASALPAEVLVICPRVCVLAATFTAPLMQNSPCAALTIPETQTPDSVGALPQTKADFCAPVGRRDIFEMTKSTDVMITEANELLQQ